MRGMSATASAMAMAMDTDDTRATRDSHHHHHHEAATATVPVAQARPTHAHAHAHDWPTAAFEASTFQRRPSWQVDGALSSSFGSTAADRTPVLQQQAHQHHQQQCTLEASPSFSPSGSPRQYQTSAASSPTHATTATTSTTRVHNPFALSLHGLPPRASPSSPPKHHHAVAAAPSFWHPQAIARNLTFVSPFEAPPLIHQSIASPVEAPLSPYCLPSSPFSPTNTSHSGSYAYDYMASSPLGLLGTPASSVRSSLSSTSGGNGNCNGTSSSSSSSKLLAAAPLHQQAQQTHSAFEAFLSSSLNSNAQRQPARPKMKTGNSGSSIASDRSASFYQPLSINGVVAPSSPLASSDGFACSPTTSSFASHVLRSPQKEGGANAHLVVPAPEDDNTQYRRRSVDVGTLGNMRGHQRSGRTSQADAPAAAFVPPDQLKAHRAKRVSTQRSRDSLFSQHLTSILSHSVSLCSVRDPDAESGSTSASPRSSISSVISNGSYVGSESREPVVFTDGNSSKSIAQAQAHVPASRRTSSLAPQLRLQLSWHVTAARRKELIGLISKWSFDANQLDLDELCECACIIFESALEIEGLAEAVGGTSARMRSFLGSLRAAYHPQNAYHNFAHAVDVLQACYSFVVQLGVAPPLERFAQEDRNKVWKRDAKLATPGAIGEILRPIDVFCLLIAAIGHDVGHPGLSNAYMINARTPAAQVYNDKSVLENFHSVTLIRMLKLHGFGHLLDVDGGGATDFRQVLLTSVLVTDMSRHFPFVEKLKDLGTRSAQEGYQSKNVSEDRLLICAGLMKCADISNPTRPHEVAACWSTALLEEWAVQAEIETRYDLPVSVVLLKPNERTAQAKSQVGFIKLFTQPLFDAMAVAIPDFQPFADYCRNGREVWEALLQQGEEEATAAPAAVEQAQMPPEDSPSCGSVSSSPGSDWGTTLHQHVRRSIGSDKSTLPPHRALRSMPSHESNLTATSGQSEMGSLMSVASAASTFATSPATSTFYNSASPLSPLIPIASPTSNPLSAWIPSANLEASSDLAEESCTNNCSDITALCSTCARLQRAQDSFIHGGYAPSYLAVPQYLSSWPPDPFRPAPSAKT